MPKATAWAGQVEMVRLFVGDPAAVAARDRTREVFERDHDAVGEEFPATRGDEAERFEIVQDLAFRRERIEQRAVGNAHAEVTQALGIRDPAALEVLAPARIARERALIKLHHAREELQELRREWLGR